MATDDPSQSAGFEPYAFIRKRRRRSGLATYLGLAGGATSVWP